MLYPIMREFYWETVKRVIDHETIQLFEHLFSQLATILIKQQRFFNNIHHYKIY